MQTKILIAAIAATFLISLANAAQRDRVRPGDLVEYQTPYGPVMGEVLGGPDPSSYYLLAIPGRAEPFAIGIEKLHLVQSAGVANATTPLDEDVRAMLRGHAFVGAVRKVNGAWCQVEATDGSVFSWIKCAELRAAGP